MTTPSQFHSPLLPILLAGAAQMILAAMAGQELPVTLLGCPDKCGNISIPFPFGMKPGCFREGFEVTCNTSLHPPAAFLASTGSFQGMMEMSFNSTMESSMSLGPTVLMPIELIDMSLEKSEARVYGAVPTYCYTDPNNSVTEDQAMQLDLNGPFALSPRRNVVIGVGWRVIPRLSSECLGPRPGNPITCFARLDEDLQFVTNGSCGSRGCCAASLPESPPITSFDLTFKYQVNLMWETTPYSYAMLVESSEYNFSSPDMYGYKVFSNRFPKGVPTVLDFAIGNGSCPVQGQLQPPPDYACLSANSYCNNANSGRGYVCKCAEHYDGNPYIPDGCIDINECESRDKYPCSNNGVCKNRQGGYDCPCKTGMKGDGKAGTCATIFPVTAKVAVGGIGGVFFMAALSFLILLHKEKKKAKEFYRKNGGPTLEKAKIIKLFKKEDLKPILKSSNIIGKGGFGEVYKGILGHVLVAVKKPITGSAGENEQFTNEIIILSQVNHKNIVRLIGCCLEVDIPMLVYEFLPNGSLHDILHNNNKQPFNLGLRLAIAAESADGLAYMHSKTSTKILHGDVKPANILLDDNYVPKISDFGISRLIPRDKYHTVSIIGDQSYMDPVFKQTGLLTEKSDVYSFGVLLLELISRKKATHSDNNSLVRNFLESRKNETTTTELFDNEITETMDLVLLDSLAEIAVKCLDADVDQRPAMKEIAERLLMLNGSRAC